VWRVDLATPCTCALRSFSLGWMTGWQLDLFPASGTFRDFPEHLAGGANAAVTARAEEPVFDARSHLLCILKR
tara:strand:- start:203 stop:421 length:219 start_codon:yes stop_codon:yes gene_type:complete